MVRRTRHAAIALCLFLVLGSTLFAQGTSENEHEWVGYQFEPVSSNASASENPSVCVDPHGQVHMAWEDHRFDHGTEVCYARRSATGAKVVEDLPVGRDFYDMLEQPLQDYDAHSPCVLMDGDGEASVVFLEEHWKGSYNHYGFAIRQVEVDDSGKVHRTNSVLNWTVYTGGFSTSARLAQGLVVEPDDDGGYHLMFTYPPDIRDYDEKQVYYARLDEAFEVSIGPLVLTDYSSAMVWGPDVTVAGGNVHAVLARSPVRVNTWNTTEYDYMVIDGSDGIVVKNVTGFARMESPIGDHRLAALDTDAHGLVHMVMVGGSDGSLLYSRTDADGEVLVAPTAFHEGGNEDVSMDIEGSGVLHALVSSGSDPLGSGSHLWYAKFNLTDTIPQMHHYWARIEGPITSPGQGQARLAIDDEGQAFIVWDDRARVGTQWVDMAMYTTNAVTVPDEVPGHPEHGTEGDTLVATMGMLVVVLCIVVFIAVLVAIMRMGGTTVEEGPDTK